MVHKSEGEIMKRTALSLAAAALMLSSAAFAQGYVGIAGGASKVDVDCAGTTTCDTTSTGWKLFGGYKFTPNWAAEVGYFDFGKAKFAGSNVTTGNITAEVKGTGFGAGVALSGEFAPSWTGVARLGVASVKAKVSGTVTGGTLTPAGSISDSETSTNAYFGLGVGYLIAKNMSIDGAMDFSRGKWQGEKADVRLVSIGLTYSF